MILTMFNGRILKRLGLFNTQVDNDKTWDDVTSLQTRNTLQALEVTIYKNFKQVAVVDDILTVDMVETNTKINEYRQGLGYVEVRFENPVTIEKVNKKIFVKKK